MIKRYGYNKKIDTGAVVVDVEEGGALPYFEEKDGVFSYRMDDDAKVFGLGEAVRGIDKRGWVYRSFCSDDPFHTEEKSSLYGAHNFLIIDSKRERFGVFFDTAAEITFDVGYENPEILRITPKTVNVDVYIIEEETLCDIARAFRRIIGRSYIPPFWAFGYGQSRWSYAEKESVLRVADNYQKAGIPLDAIYLDIDYMEQFEDFTVSEERFPDFNHFVAEMKERGIHLVPIIDAAVKVKDGYRVYEEGKKSGFFCKDENGEDFVVGVWPGNSVLPDFLNKDASKWFGSQYKFLTDMGVDGFWNDMNEPALFYSEKGLKDAFQKAKAFEGKTLDATAFFSCRDVFSALSNAQSDYDGFFHETESGRVRHSDAHNLYGAFMTRSAGEALDKLRSERTLLFSRASAVGAHRWGGIWTGDNHSWWSHILQSLKQMPSLNLCGFLFSGSDIGGFNGNCTRDLMLRWLSLGIFTPLMRNHSACGTRDQEAYAFGDTEDFRHIISLRYRLLPYLYSEFVKAALRDEMFIRPLAFDFEEDAHARDVEDQVMVGESVMFAPVYTQNAKGRYVYLPEDMTQVRMHKGEISLKEQKSGHHFIDIPLSDVVFFIRKGGAVPLARPAMNTRDLDTEHLTLIGTGTSYELYADDGVTKDVSLENLRVIKK